MNDAWDIVEGDVSIRDGRIATIARNISDRHDRVIEAHGGYVLPGLVQTHIHLCQTLFRGYADDLKLMDWLRAHIWLGLFHERDTIAVTLLEDFGIDLEKRYSDRRVRQSSSRAG